MYYVSGKSANGDVFVVDTSDGVVDRCTKKEIIKFAQQVEIKGVYFRNNILRIEVYNPNEGLISSTSNTMSSTNINSQANGGVSDTVQKVKNVSLESHFNSDNFNNLEETNHSDVTQPILKPRTSVLGFMKREERKRNEEVIKSALKNRDNTERVDNSSSAQELISLGDDALKHILVKNALITEDDCNICVKKHCSTESLRERTKSTDFLTYTLALGEACRRRPASGIHTSTFVLQSFYKNNFNTIVRLHYKIDSVDSFFEDDSYVEPKAFEEATKNIPITLSLVKAKSRFTLQINILGDRLIYAKDITDSYLLSSRDKKNIKASYLHACLVVQSIIAQKVSNMQFSEVMNILDKSAYFKVRNEICDKLWYYDMADLRTEPLEIKVRNVIELSKRRICVLEDNLKFF